MAGSARSRLSGLGGAAALVLVPAALACGPDSVADPGVPFAVFADRMTQTLCDNLNTCGGVESMPYRDNCPLRLGGFVREGFVPAVQDGVNDGRIVYHPLLGDACLGQLAACGLINQLPPACLAAIEGLVATGKDCRDSLDCGGDAYCDAGGGLQECPGACAPWKQDGEPCAADTECARGFKCLGSPALCTDPAADGEPCTSQDDCDYYLLCVNVDDRRICERQLHVSTAPFGEPCGALEEPFSAPLCAGRLVCASGEPGAAGAGATQQATCQETVSPGEACHPAFLNQCPQGQYCDTATLRCIPLPTTGQACVDLDYLWITDECQPQHGCSPAGICEARRPNGEICQNDAQCLSTKCSDNHCTPDYACKLPRPRTESDTK